MSRNEGIAERMVQGIGNVSILQLSRRNEGIAERMVQVDCNLSVSVVMRKLPKRWCKVVVEDVAQDTLISQ